MLSGTGPAERSESSILISINSVICPISNGNLPLTLISKLIELNTTYSYIFVTLPFLHDIPLVSEQQAVEEIDDIPELSIPQSVAARAIVRNEHRLNIMYPILCIGRGRVL
jgi:hypothetical protein